MKYLETVIQSGLFERVSKGDYIETFEHLKISGRSYRKNEIIYYEGDLIDKVCIIEKGSVRGEKTYTTGDVHITDLFDKGDIFALEIACSRSRVSAIDYISNEDTTVVFISMSSLENSRQSKELKRAIGYMLSDSNIKMAHKLEILAERKLRNRIMIYLDILSRKANDSTVNVKMSREQMAQFLCVNRSALSNELSKMKREGIIDFKGKTFVIKKQV